MNPVLKAFDFSTSKSRKKTIKYKVVKKGVTISKHYLKKEAVKSAKSKGGRVVSASYRPKRKTTSKRRRRTYI